MKKIKLNVTTPPQFVNIWAVGMVLFALLIGKGALAQPYLIGSGLGDPQLASINQAINTGHAVWTGNGNNGLAAGCRLTATVWDGTKGGIYITAGPTKIYSNDWSHLVGEYISDPDVAISFLNDVLYVNVVGVDNNNQIKFITAVPQCYNGDFTLNNISTCTIGKSTPGYTSSFANGTYTASGRKCSNPNIDANKDGKIAIVWQEGQSYTFHFSFPAPVPPFSKASPGFNIDTTYYEYNIMAMHGFADGKRYDNTDFCGTTGTACGNRPIKYYYDGRWTEQVPNYFQITGQTSTHEFNGTDDLHHCYNPDVSIGQGTNPYVTYAYMNGQQLNVYQQAFGTCPDTTVDTRLSCFTGWVGYKPRVASKPSSLFPNDFIVVGGYEAKTENCSGGLTGYYGTIVGVIVNGGIPAACSTGGTPIPAVILNNNANLLASLNSDPVVDYYLDQDESTYSTLNNSSAPGDADLANSFVVVWKATDAQVSGASQEGTDQDVIGRLYKANGTPLFPGSGAGTAQYSFINSDTDGDQFAPSVSARYGDAAIGYAFLDNNVSQSIAKLSSDLIGNTGIDNDATTTCSNCIPVQENRFKAPDIKLYPNPGSGQFRLQLNNNNSKQAVITLSDAQGKILLKQTWQSTDGEPKVNAKDLPAGVYYVTFTPTDGNKPLKAVYTNNK